MGFKAQMAYWDTLEGVIRIPAVMMYDARGGPELVKLRKRKRTRTMDSERHTKFLPHYCSRRLKVPAFQR